MARPARPARRDWSATYPLCLRPRQAQVLSLYARGARQQQIADELGLSINTVKKHLADMTIRYDVTPRGLIALYYGDTPYTEEQSS